jgi:hypothetical protein
VLMRRPLARLGWGKEHRQSDPGNDTSSSPSSRPNLWIVDSICGDRSFCNCACICWSRKSCRHQASSAKGM